MSIPYAEVTPYLHSMLFGARPAQRHMWITRMILRKLYAYTHMDNPVYP